jgi:hypothetical protein
VYRCKCKKVDDISTTHHHSSQAQKTTQKAREMPKSETRNEANLNESVALCWGAPSLITRRTVEIVLLTLSDVLLEHRQRNLNHARWGLPLAATVENRRSSAAEVVLEKRLAVVFVGENVARGVEVVDVLVTVQVSFAQCPCETNFG